LRFWAGLDDEPISPCRAIRGGGIDPATQTMQRERLKTLDRPKLLKLGFCAIGEPSPSKPPLPSGGTVRPVLGPFRLPCRHPLAGGSQSLAMANVVQRSPPAIGGSALARATQVDLTGH